MPNNSHTPGGSHGHDHDEQGSSRAGEYVSEFLSETSEAFAAQRSSSPPGPAGLVASSAGNGPRGRSSWLFRPVAAWGRLTLAGAVGALLATLFLGFPSGTRPSAPAPTEPQAAVGNARIVSRPSGAEVFINGVRHGLAPLSLTLPAGAYRLELRHAGAVRELPLVIDAGATSGEFIDMPAATRLTVEAGEAGVGVAIDGVYRGTTPLDVTDLAPGEHRVVIGTGPAAISRTVQLEPGRDATLVVATRTLVREAGWLTIRAPIELQLIENGQVIGTSRTARVMVPAGRRNLVLANDPLGFRTTLSVEVPAGVTVPVTIPVPDDVAGRGAAGAAGESR